MRLKNHLIATLPDFERHFSFPEFWQNRRQFIRDMNPDKIYYWNDELKSAFHSVKEWIEHQETCGGDQALQQEKGLTALNTLLNGHLDMDSVNIMDGRCVNVAQQIIPVQAGQAIDLPAYTGGARGIMKLRLHKLEIHGSDLQPAKISIGGKPCGELHEGEVAYVTELDGGCIELLPNHLRNNVMELSLLGQQGEFRSTLVVQDLLSDSKLMFDGVTSFALLNEGYIYIDAHQKPVYMMTHVPKFMLKHEAAAISVKAKEDTVVVLYEDGVMKSTASMSPIPNVFHPKFDSKGNVITNHL